MVSAARNRAACPSRRSRPRCCSQRLKCNVKRKAMRDRPSCRIQSRERQRKKEATSMKPFIRILTACLLSMSAVAFAQGGDDPVLGAMRAEMDRSKTNLKLNQEKAPYYIE